MKKLKQTTILFLSVFFTQLTFGQQWFLKDFDISSNVTQLPDYKAGGTYMANDNNAVLVYGTMGYTNNELSGAEGGHGQSDIVVLQNDLDGNMMYAFTLGTSHREVVSRVIQDSEGNLVISGYREDGDEKKVFVAKVKVLMSTSGNYGFALLWAKDFGVGIPTDMINVRTGDVGNATTTGYAVCGFSDSKGFLMNIDLNGDVNTSGHYANYYEKASTALKFTSIIQYAAKVSREINEQFQYEVNFILSGSLGNNGYAASILTHSGNVVKDIDFGSVYFNCGSYPTPKTLVSVDQAFNGDMAFFGASGSSLDEIHLIGFEYMNGFDILWDRKISGGQPSMHGFPFDMNATAYGYIGIYQYSGSSYRPYKTVEYDFNGNVTRYDNLVHQNNFNVEYYLHNEKHQVTGMNQYPYVDFTMECNKALHMSGTESVVPVPPSGWAEDKIAHARLRLNAQSCIEEEFTLSTNFCDDAYYFGQDLSINKTSTLPEEVLDIDLTEVTPAEDVYCESVCPKSACTAPVRIIGESGDWVTLSTEGGYDFYVWSTGSNEDQIFVNIKGFDTYSVDQVDANGCVTTLFFEVSVRVGRQKSPSLTSNEIQAFPNPFTDEVSITVQEEGLNLEVLDYTGKLVLQKDNIQVGKEVIDLAQEAKGIYFLRVFGNGTDESFKLIKQ